jgi:glutamate synthase (NADPH/NADH) large chain
MTGGVVCVLGPVGRNFAAGMSGGIAYVYDPDRAMQRQCNLESVTLEGIAPPGSSWGDGAPAQRAASVHDSGMGHPFRYDAERLHILLKRHQLATGSSKAAELLASWPEALQHFIKVVPTDYRRALADPESELHAVAAE